MKAYFSRLTLLVMALVLAVSVLIGCGGSGSNNTSDLQVFATDDLNLGYSGVWVKFYKAELKSTTNGSVTIFNDPNGLTVNLRSLNDGLAKFILFAHQRVPNDTYNKLEFDVDSNLTLVASPSGTATQNTFPVSLNAATAGHSTLTLNLNPALTIPGTNSIVVDFDLANWTVSGSVVTPVLTRHNGNGLNDPNRHHPFEFKGLANGITGAAPNQSFTLDMNHGGSVTVTTDDTTQIISDGGSTNLTNSARVEVFGTFDPLTNSVAAKIIRLESEFEHEDKVIGTLSNPLVGNLTFQIAPTFTRGFSPMGETITVHTTANTHFRGRHGANMTETEFYASLLLLGPNSTAEVEGTYDSGTNTLTATSVHVESEADLGEDEAKGTTSVPNSVASTFDMTIQESEGFTAPNGPLHVLVDANADIKGSNGSTISLSSFFNILAGGTKTVELKGAFNNNVFTASRIKIDD